MATAQRASELVREREREREGKEACADVHHRTKVDILNKHCEHTHEDTHTTNTCVFRPRNADPDIDTYIACTYTHKHAHTGQT